MLGVDFWRSDWDRFRVCNVGPRSVFVSDVLLGGGFNRICVKEYHIAPIYGRKRDWDYFGRETLAGPI